MESVVATITQFGTRRTRDGGEVFTLTADGVEYSTFKRDIWQAAAPFAHQVARINYIPVQRGDREYRNLDSVESANGATGPTPLTPPTLFQPQLVDPPITPDFQRPKHPADREDIARAVALDKAVASLPHLSPQPGNLTEVLIVADFYLEWLRR